MSLSDTKVYPFLEGTIDGKQKYKQYCDYCNSSRRSAEIFTQLKNDIETNDYDIKKGAIVIDEHNFILDGQHRSCILLHKYGPFHKVQVVQYDMGRHLGKRMRLKYFLHYPINWSKNIFLWIKNRCCHSNKIA